jgi:hypothetical protein
MEYRQSLSNFFWLIGWTVFAHFDKSLLGSFVSIFIGLRFLISSLFYEPSSFVIQKDLTLQIVFVAIV